MQAEFVTADRLTDLLTYVVEDVSLNFDRWDDRYVRGPSLYFVVVAGVSADEYADPLGTNRWPVDTARQVERDLTAVVEAADRVAFERDGAVVVAVDGTIQEQMVRIRTPGDRGLVDGDYPEWMSAKQLSALEVSADEEVLAAVTLSEETGRVAVFRDGEFEAYERSELGSPWRATADDRGSEDADARGQQDQTRTEEPDEQPATTETEDGGSQGGRAS